MEQAYAAIGRAVVASQLFETALAPIFEFFKMKTEPGYLEKTGGYVSAGAYRVPVKSIINTLSAKGQLAPDLEERLSKFVEDRHTLIHRWVQQNGLPEDGDLEGFRPIAELANRVQREAEQLTGSFAGYMVKYANPEWAAQHGQEFESRMANLFHRAHIDGQ